MNRESIRVGFVGFGRMGITHYSILNNHPNVNIVAVCDASKMMLRVLGKYVDVATYTDFREMIDSDKLDAIVVSTPASSHAEIVRVGLDRGLHTFVEKPFTLTAADSREIVDRLDGQHVVNQVGYVNRFNEVFDEARRLLQLGVIGDVRRFRSEMYGATVTKDSKSSWRSKQAQGGGCMYEFASHCIDLAVYLFGEPVGVSGSTLQSIYSSTVEDVVSSNLEYGNGCLGEIAVNWSDMSYRKPANVVTAIGKDGKLIADRYVLKLFLRHARPDLGFHEGWNTKYITDIAKPVRVYVRGNEFTNQLDDFVAAIADGRATTRCSFADAAIVDRIMEQIREDAAGEGVGARANEVSVRPATTRSWISRLLGAGRLDRA
ncbi:MAG: Gfo/Idh/MocA family oxidoreductase [Gammaproteobacteria bacterium]|nr:Gfo/Idh/MocA family oxidoreductase [Gammaproteobacteria bacterium]